MRPFIGAPELAFATLARWTNDASHFIARAPNAAPASEGSRPRSALGGLQLKALIADLSPRCRLSKRCSMIRASTGAARTAAQRRQPPERYRQDHPALVVGLDAAPRPTLRSERRALLWKPWALIASRTLIKQGDARMLKAQAGAGVAGTATLGLQPKKIRVGDSLR